jgi:hypothetical protein
VTEDAQDTADSVDSTDAKRSPDPVDLELMRRSWQRREPGRDASRNRRRGALLAVVVLFVVLMVLGVLLASHAKSEGGQGLGIIVSPHLALTVTG